MLRGFLLHRRWMWAVSRFEPLLWLHHHTPKWCESFLLSPQPTPPPLCFAQLLTPPPGRPSAPCPPPAPLAEGGPLPGGSLVPVPLHPLQGSAALVTRVLLQVTNLYFCPGSCQEKANALESSIFAEPTFDLASLPAVISPPLFTAIYVSGSI